MKHSTNEHEEEYFHIIKRGLKHNLFGMISFFMCYPLIGFIFIKDIIKDILKDKE